MYRALYRTWRPQTFDDVCGQSHVTDILKYQVAEGKTSHAYLFCGSRGTGKTSCAKILAKAVNCLHPVNGNPCNECEACRAIDAGTATDVIEMDAASNNGVDHVRDLKEEIVFMPAALRYRVYIIDEVHMMSTNAFNALLKTLEEPPSYVLFILATTELHKLPSTIVSRCQRYDFRRMTAEVIMDRLHAIAKAEGMDLLPDGARMIARAAQGGMRDAISMLELCAGANAPIDETLAASVLGVGNRDTVFRVAEAINARDYATLYGIVGEIVMSSGNLGVFWQQLGDLFRDMMVFRTVPDPRAYLDLTDTEYERLQALSQDVSIGKLYYRAKLIDDTMPELQRSGTVRRAAAEIALTRMCDPRTYAVPEALLARVEELERTVKLLKMGVPQETPAPAPTATPAPAPRKVPQDKPAPTPAPEKAVPTLTPIGGWKDTVDEFGTLFPMYASILAASRGYTDGQGTLTVRMQDAFLIGSFEGNAAATSALIRLVGERTGSTPRTLRVERANDVQPLSQNEDSFF